MLKKLKPTRLGQRIIIYVLFPTIFLLLGSGYITFNIAKNLLIKEWTANTHASLEKGAAIINHQLQRPKGLLELIRLAPVTGDNDLSQVYLLKELEKNPLVMRINQKLMVDGKLKNQDSDIFDSHLIKDGIRNLSITTTPSEYKTLKNSNSILLSYDFIHLDKTVIGQIEVILSLPTLVTELTTSSWWKMTFLVDENGETIGNIGMNHNNSTDKLSASHWSQMQNERFGVILGPERPPKEVCLFYHLNTVPWTLVVNGNGKNVLHPLQRFRNIFFIITAITTLSIILTIQLVTSKINKQITELSNAAKKLANGQWGEPLQISNNDEINTLKENFNQMTSRLQQGVQLQKSMEIAREVQQNLLPKGTFQVAQLDVAATCIYYDDTGGDYFDILQCAKHKHTSLIVGDVVGHGIGAALLMASTRSLIRGRLSCSKSLAKTITQVNKLICDDTQKVGNFVTLFILRINYESYKLEWIRAGHEPAIVFYPKSNKFIELKEKGLALGVDNDYVYGDNQIVSPSEPSVILLGTDGIWDAENCKGEQFGKERSLTVIAENAHLPAKDIMAKLKGAIGEFIGSNKQTDDITLMIVKLPESS